MLVIVGRALKLSAIFQECLKLDGYFSGFCSELFRSLQQFDGFIFIFVT